MFGHIQPGPPDPMFTLKKNADNDRSLEKIDLGVGIYRNEAGSYQELEVVRQYGTTTGDVEFLRLAAGVMFGERNDALNSGKISSVQTISGTGANSLGALLISKTMQPKPKVFIGVPTWGNHVPIFQEVGLETTTYPYLDSSKHAVDFPGFLAAVRSAPRGSVFVLQGCCHNPTGVDLSVQQWQELAIEMKSHGHLPFFDTAYQGLGDGLDEDAAGVRVFAESGMEFLVCQSFSKNFALYGERCGVLHVVGSTKDVATNVQDKLRSLIRHTYSSSPAYGSRLVKIALSDSIMRGNWTAELDTMRERLKTNRQLLHHQLTNTPGDWSHLIKEKGLFSCLALSPSQCKKLVSTYHVHLPESGRINIAGLSKENAQRAASAIDKVIRA
ncbi:Aspartate aminotransferase [Colletotrichum higginsianum IMI 349063]|uniref:Aspartate aminotransferase n=1 Tax=Colletotrichum higginsianum (strain IMI 349063) TaxID=759273 RepID=A0A1B7YW99_COLHI|nr:Aspartate aminotransferase [Colletotrichum higginsianum IMI 349063]OBR16148.1 Aspartate aminotransferase [Colletotrichum higginsianum IMI 349063]